MATDLERADNCCGNDLFDVTFKKEKERKKTFDMGQILVNKTRNWGNLKYEGGYEQEYELFSFLSFADFIHLLKISSHRKYNFPS